MPYHSYIFFDAEPSLSLLSDEVLKENKKIFANLITNSTDFKIEAYATLALKAATRFLLHINATTPDAIQILVRDLLQTPLGKHLRITYTLMGMTRPSQYNPKSPPKESASATPHRYLVVYPFTKTIEWHYVPFEERRNIMKAHVDVGRKYSATISQTLLYSYGIDDHEFIVSYQMDSLEQFQSLVMDMRETESRRYTKNDLPIFTCIHMTVAEALDMI